MMRSGLTLSVELMGWNLVRKIMLVIDDYQELVVFENLLRRLGFDVLSLGKELLVGDALFKFHPDIVIATSQGRSVDGFKVAARVKKQVPPPKVALAYTNGSPPSLSLDMRILVDGLIALPVQPANIIKLVAKLGGLKAEPLLDKFKKIMNSPAAPKSEEIRVMGPVSETSESIKVSSANVTAPPAPGDVWDPVKSPGKAAEFRSERSNRYDVFLRDNDEEVEQHLLSRAHTQAAIERLKAASEGERELIDEINREKLKFAETMFVDAKPKRRAGRKP